jgi:hypothetical protein
VTEAGKDISSEMENPFGDCLAKGIFVFFQNGMNKMIEKIKIMT